MMSLAKTGARYGGSSPERQDQQGDRRLGLTDETVKNYLSNAMDKSKTSRRLQAALYIRQGPRD